MKMPIHSLRDTLASTLPADASFTFHHIHSRPARCAALYSAPPDHPAEPTTLESHFFTVSINAHSSTHDDSGSAKTISRDSQAEHNASRRVFAFAIELFIYKTSTLTTVFVSKADSTGFLTNLVRNSASTSTSANGSTSKSQQRPSISPVKAVARALVAYTLRRQRRNRPHVRVNVSLFARAQGQYLFPCSVDNGLKHVLDDRGLVRWWCSVLDPILDGSKDNANNGAGAVKGSRGNGYLLIPGLEKYETLRFTPRNNALPRVDATPRWSHGHPLLQLSAHPDAPPRCLVPHFPDDPKARFLNELDDELPDSHSQKSPSKPKARAAPSSSSSIPKDALKPSTLTSMDGQWRSVGSLAQFWELMAYRQECSAGRLVGFIWLMFSPDATAVAQDSKGTMTRDAPPTRKTPQLKRLTGPIITTSASTNVTAIAAAPTPTVPPAHEPATDKMTILPLDTKTYDRATALLLNLSFENLDTATASTDKWVRHVGVMAGIGPDVEWGWSVRGTDAGLPGHTLDSAASTATPVINGRDSGVEKGAVNVLNGSMIRKKRRGESVAETSSEPVRELEVAVRDGGTTNDNGNGSVNQGQGGEVVNTLSAGLVRKKRKT